MARAWSRRLAAAQTISVIREGGRTVSLGSILGPEFAAAPALLFGPDQFHPSAEGYRALARLLLPSVLAALGLAPDDEERARDLPRRGRDAGRPGRDACRQPARHRAGRLRRRVAGGRVGVRDRLVELRHRRRRPQVAAQAPEASEG